MAQQQAAAPFVLRDFPGFDSGLDKGPLQDIGSPTEFVPDLRPADPAVDATMAAVSAAQRPAQPSPAAAPRTGPGEAAAQPQVRQDASSAPGVAAEVPSKVSAQPASAAQPASSAQPASLSSQAPPRAQAAPPGVIPAQAVAPPRAAVDVLSSSAPSEPMVLKDFPMPVGTVPLVSVLAPP